jgi:hypothetical protein
MYVYNSSIDNFIYNQIQHFLHTEILYYGYWTPEHFPLFSNNYVFRTDFEKMYDKLVVWIARAISVLTFKRLTFEIVVALADQSLFKCQLLVRV